MRILTLTNEQVASLAKMGDSVDELKKAFLVKSEGHVEAPPRARFQMSDVRNILWMPSLVRGRDTMSLKLVTFYPDLGPGAISTRAIVILVDGKNGDVKCIMGGTGLTGIRTGAVSGLSCRYLARKDSRKMAMLGAGGQGFYQISGVASQLGIEEVKIFDIDKGRQKTLIERCEKELHLRASASDAVRDAVSDADVVVTATTARTPILDGADVKPGTHVVAIGAYTPETRELGSDLIARASVYVDEREAAMDEAGDVIIPIKEGRIARDEIKGELADLVSGKVPGRTSDSQVTVFKAVGLAFEDNAVGWMIYDRAVAAGVGAWTEA